MLMRLQRYFDIESSSVAGLEVAGDLHACRQDITQWMSETETVAEEDVDDYTSTSAKTPIVVVEDRAVASNDKYAFTNAGQDSASKIVRTGPGGRITEADRMKA